MVYVALQVLLCRIITGVLLKALESYKSNPQHFDSLKIAGDKFIADREQSKNLNQL